MPDLLLAADTPRRFAAATIKRRRCFLMSDAERFAWLSAEYRRALRPGLKKAAIAFELALEAFDVSLDDLRQPGRQPRARAKIMCAVRILSGASYVQIAAKLGVHRSAAFRAHKRLGAAITALLAQESAR